MYVPFDISYPKIPGYSDKFGRANEHFKSLDAEEGAFFDAHPYRLISELDPQSGKHRVYMHAEQPPPMRVSLIIGDVLHNFRSALDHLAWHLANLHHGGTRDTQFPIYENRNLFHQRGGKANNYTAASGFHRIAQLHPAAQARIELLQPYQRTNGPPDLHPLWLLRNLSNEDKHQILPLVSAIMDDAGLSGAVAENAEIIGSGITYGTVEDGAEVAWLQTRPRDPANRAKVNLQVKGTPKIAFSKEGVGRGLPVLTTLRDIARTVAEVGWALEPCS